MPAKKPPKCLCGECGQPPRSRGLGHACYQAAARMVRLGETTWDALEAAGLALPTKPRNATRRTPIRRKIEALTSKAG